MSAGLRAVQSALATLLADIAPVHERAPPRARFPYLLISDSQISDWSHKSGEGRELRLGLTLWDDETVPGRLLELAAAVDLRMRDFPRDLPGWRIAGFQYLRTMVSRAPEPPSAALFEYRLRMEAL